MCVHIQAIVIISYAPFVIQTVLQVHTYINALLGPYSPSNGHRAPEVYERYKGKAAIETATLSNCLGILTNHITWTKERQQTYRYIIIIMHFQ